MTRDSKINLLFHKQNDNDIYLIQWFFFNLQVLNNVITFVHALLN
jgi:hypothetical protein